MRNLPDFYKAMQDKFDKSAKEKDKTLEPWNRLDGFLLMRLGEEYAEFRESIKGTNFEHPHDYDEKELLDIANFCRFLWIKKKLKE